jgi:hypothetical protein
MYGFDLERRLAAINNPSERHLSNFWHSFSCSPLLPLEADKSGGFLISSAVPTLSGIAPLANGVKAAGPTKRSVHRCPVRQRRRFRADVAV